MKYQNPIMKGFYPDPSICRVEKDYYLVTSSMEYFPAIPLFHSRDLVNWQQIGNCISRQDVLPLKKSRDSCGVWAPTIRYDQGRFYVTATLEGYGNFIIFTDDPYADWSGPVWVPVGGIDPSLYFEDGRAYYCTNYSLHAGIEEITLEEIDIETGALKSAVISIWSGTGGGHLEAPHIYKIGGWYYLMAAEGGTNFNHMVTISRSRSLWGPYEGYKENPVLTNRHDTIKKVQCTGHGDLIQDHRGNWWMVHLGVRLARRTMSHLGRETFLTPVFWKDGWPSVGEDKLESLEKEGPLWEKQELGQEWEPDFKNVEWEPQWIFVRERRENLFRRGDGTLKLYASTGKSEQDMGNAFAAVRPLDFDCVIETEFQFQPEHMGDEAGIAIYLESGFHYRFGKKRTEQGDFLILEKTAEDFQQTACHIPVGSEKLRLKIQCTKEMYHFYYALGKEKFRPACTASTRFLSCEVAGRCFSGTVIGLYARAEEQTNAFAEFQDFSMRTECLL